MICVQAMPYMVTLIVIEALINWLARGQRLVMIVLCHLIKQEGVEHSF